MSMINIQLQFCSLIIMCYVIIAGTSGPTPLGGGGGGWMMIDLASSATVVHVYVHISSATVLFVDCKISFKKATFLAPALLRQSLQVIL